MLTFDYCWRFGSFGSIVDWFPPHKLPNRTLTELVYNIPLASMGLQPFEPSAMSTDVYLMESPL